MVKLKLQQFSSRNCFTMCADCALVEGWKMVNFPQGAQTSPSFNNCAYLSRLNPSQHKTDGKERRRHINTTQIILIKILWRTFFRAGALFWSGRPCAFVGLKFLKENGKIGTVLLPCRARILKGSGVNEFLSSHSFRRFFSLRDLNARHFIWPGSVCFLGKFLFYIRRAYKTLFLFLWIVQVCLSKRESPIIQPKMHPEKGSDPKTQNISFKLPQTQHVSGKNHSRASTGPNAKMIDITRWIEPFLSVSRGREANLGQTHSGLLNPSDETALLSLFFNSFRLFYAAD